MKHLLSLFPLLWGSLIPGQTSYTYNVDLTDLQDDRLHVELFVPAAIGYSITYWYRGSSSRASNVSSIACVMRIG
jgi:hypothetical protein